MVKKALNNGLSQHFHLKWQSCVLILQEKTTLSYVNANIVHMNAKTSIKMWLLNWMIYDIGNAHARLLQEFMGMAYERS